MLRSVLRLGIALALAIVAACASHQSGEAGATPSRSLEMAMRATRRDPHLAGLLAPREAAFQRDPEPPAPPRLVSEGWRTAASHPFEGLGARLPERANERMDVGIAQYERLRLGVTLRDAAPSEVTVDAGRAIYRNVFPATDRIVAASASELEDLLVLRDETAPRAFAWDVAVPDGIERVVEEGGGLSFRASGNRVALRVQPPYLVDANGERRALTLHWTSATNTLQIALSADERAVAWPAVIDPTFDTWTWFETPFLYARYLHAMAYDSIRHQVVLFGGQSDTSFLGDTWLWDGRAWTQATPPISPPPRAKSAMAFDATRGRIVLFGGEGGYLADTWLWDGATWSLASPTTSPPVRNNHAMTFDAARQRVVLFGGFDGQGTTYNDTWLWDGTNWTKPATPVAPPARSTEALGFDATSNRVVLFGGGGASGALADTWLWDGASWSLASPATSPSARTNASIAFDPAHNELLLFGGCPATSSTDTWAWTGATWAPRATTVAPSGACASAMAPDALNHVVAYGGSPSSGTYTAETWTWTGTWNRVTTPVAPAARSFQAMAYDAARSKTVLFGGTLQQSGARASDTWQWDGSQWVQLQPANAPPARSSFAMAFDAARSRVVLFGGAFDNSTLLGDTWTWDGTAWTNAMPATSPLLRWGHAMAFDAMHGRVVMFGGITGTTSQTTLQDTWTWDGTTWLRATTATSPAPRFAHAMTYDSVRNRVVLFGGTALVNLLGDTWLWDGSAWTQVATALAPPARARHSLAFDTHANVAVLFGGTGATDTWLWNGSVWTAAGVARNAPARIGGSLVYDALHDTSVLFGGVGSSTWILDRLGASCATDANCPGSYCVDGECCSTSSCGTCETCAGVTPGRCSSVLNAEDSDTCALRDGKSCSGLGDCKLALGAASTTPSACASGFVVDGVCCATPSCGPCQTCDLAKKESAVHPGLCDPVAGGTDPRDDCADDGAASCKRDGLCDGRGACRIYAAGSPCGDNVCSENRASGRFCTGAGECKNDPDARDCGAFACVRGACKTQCVDNGDCAALHHCANGGCIADRGSTCADEHTLVSPTGAVTDCGLFKCQGSMCLASCTNRSDCTGNADCTADHTCMVSSVSGSDSGGCTLGRGARDRWALGGWLALFVLGRRRSVRRGASNPSNRCVA